MSRCTAPVRGHKTASGAANCPVCRYQSRGYRSSPTFDSYLSPNSSPSNFSVGNYSYRKGRIQKANWSKGSSEIFYTPSEIRTLTPVRKIVEQRSEKVDLRDIFLCHAWDDRKESAQELHDLLESKGISVWFSEKDVSLGTSLLREIDKGLAKSKIGIVLVTPSFIKRIQNDGIADKELSALLARDQLVPIVHNTTFEDLRDASPLLGSRSGLSTSDESMEIISSKLAELISV